MQRLQGILFLLLLGCLTAAPGTGYSQSIDEALEELYEAADKLKKEDAVRAFALVEDFEKAHPSLSPSQHLEILRIKTRVSIRDQFNFNYPKYLRDYLIEAKRLQDQRHIFISKRLLFVFHLFNETAKPQWLMNGLSYFKETKDTAEILANESVLYIHHLQQGDMDSGHYYAQHLIAQQAYLLRHPRLVNLLNIPCEWYSTFEPNDSLYQHYKGIAMKAGFIRHPKDSTHLLKNEISLALNEGNMDTIPVLFKKTYRLCDSESYIDTRLRTQFLNMEKYYYRAIGNKEKELEVASAYIRISRKVNTHFHKALMDDLMNGELLSNLEVARQKERDEKKMVYIGATGAFLLLLVGGLAWFRGLKAKRRVIQQKLEISETQQRMLALKLQNEKLEKEQLMHEAERRKQEILYLTSGLKQKSNLLQELNNGLKTALVSDSEAESSQHVQTAIKKIASSKNFSKEWDNIYERYQELNPEFFKKVSAAGGHVSVGDLKLSALISLNFNNDEIASILNIESRSVVIKKHRLKKKLMLQKEDNLQDYLRALS